VPLLRRNEANSLCKTGKALGKDCYVCAGDAGASSLAATTGPEADEPLTQDDAGTAPAIPAVAPPLIPVGDSVQFASLDSQVDTGGYLRALEKRVPGFLKPHEFAVSEVKTSVRISHRARSASKMDQSAARALCTAAKAGDQDWFST